MGQFFPSPALAQSWKAQERVEGFLPRTMLQHMGCAVQLTLGQLQSPLCSEVFSVFFLFFLFFSPAKSEQKKPHDESSFIAGK